MVAISLLIIKTKEVCLMCGKKPKVQPYIPPAAPVAAPTETITHSVENEEKKGKKKSKGKKSLTINKGTGTGVNI